MSPSIEKTRTPSMDAFGARTAQFSQSLKLLAFQDDSDVGLTAAADKLTVAMTALRDRLGRAPLRGDATLADLDDRLQPATDTLASFVQVFSDDVASGATSLPDMDDLAVMMGFLGQPQDQLFRLIALAPAALHAQSTADRAEFVETLTTVGIPLAEVGMTPAVMIKSIIILITTIILRQRPDAEVLVTTIVNTLAQIDRRAQGGLKLPGSGAGGSSGTPQSGGGIFTPGTPPPPPAPMPVVPVDPCAAKGEIRIIIGGTGPTEAAALADAMRNAFQEAARRCGSGCRPRALGMTDERATLIGDANTPFRTTRRFIFRCQQ